MFILDKQINSLQLKLMLIKKEPNQQIILNSFKLQRKKRLILGCVVRLTSTAADGLSHQQADHMRLKGAKSTGALTHVRVPLLKQE